MATKSLGRLTLDLVAKTGGFTGPLDKASRSTKKQMSDISKSVGKAATAVTALGVASATAAAGGLYMLTKRGLEAVDAQAKLAARLDSTIGQVRGLELAASDAGVSQGALNSSLESYNKRLGDAARGTGEAQKAYKALGLEAAAIADMPLPEQLALVADRISQLDSAAERASIADRLMSGGRRMTVLFQQGGDAIRDAVQEVEDYGLAIDAIDASVLEAANDAMSRTGLLVESLRNSLAVELAPIILEIADRFNTAAREAGGFGEIVESAVEGAAVSVAALLDQFQELRGFVKWIELGAAEMELAFAEFSKGAWESFGWFLDTAVAGVNNLIRALNAIPGFTDLDLMDKSFSGTEFMDRINRQLEVALGRRNLAVMDLHEVILGPSASSYVDDLFDDIEKRREQIANKGGIFKSLDDWLFEEPPSLGGGGGGEPGKAAKQLEDAYSSLLDKLYPLEAEQRRFREEMALLDLAAKAGEIDDLAEAQQRLRDSFKSNESFQGGPGDFGNPVDEGGSYWDQWLEGAQVALSSFDELAGNTVDRFSESFGNAFESMIFDAQSLGDAVYDMAEGMARSVVSALGEMAAQWLAYQAVQMMVGETGQKVAGKEMAANATATSMQAGIAAYASTAAIPLVGPALAPAAMQAALATTAPIAAGISALGMAHDGMDAIPQTGTWLLEKGERVTTKDTSAKLDKTLDDVKRGGSGGGGAPTINIIENPSKGGATDQRKDRDGNWVVDVVVASITGDGQVDKAMRGKYGVQPRGR